MAGQHNEEREVIRKCLCLRLTWSLTLLGLILLVSPLECFSVACEAQPTMEIEIIISKDMLVSKNVSGGSIHPKPHTCGGGGCWERTIRTTRSVVNSMLLRVNTRLKHKVLSALLPEVSSIMNAQTTLTIVSKANRGYAYETMETSPGQWNK